MDDHSIFPAPALLAETDADITAGARRAPRDSMLLAADIERIGRDHHETVRVRNISGTGLMFEAQDGWLVGDEVAVTLRGIGRVTGRVVWAADDRVGMAFDEPIDPQAARKPVRAAPRPTAPPRTRRSGLRTE